MECFQQKKALYFVYLFFIILRKVFLKHQSLVSRQFRAENRCIPPLFKKSKKTTKTITKKRIDPTVNSARLALKEMGFTLTEATSLIDKVYHERISVAELIKGCLKNVEPAKTN